MHDAGTTQELPTPRMRLLTPNLGPMILNQRVKRLNAKDWEMEHQPNNLPNKNKTIGVMGNDRSDSSTDHFTTRMNRDVTRRFKSQEKEKEKSKYSLQMPKATMGSPRFLGVLPSICAHLVPPTSGEHTDRGKY